jgi:hypothetical protein
MHDREGQFMPNFSESVGRVLRSASRRELASDNPKTVLLKYLSRMTDDTGMIQHGIGSIPDPQTGYTTDDNARALLAMVRLWRLCPERRAEVEPLLLRYLGFLLWVQQRSGDAAGRFVNFVGYDRTYLDAQGTEDSLGRTVWVLGEAVGGALPFGSDTSVRSLWSRALPHLENLHAPRARAYALLGLCAAVPHETERLRTMALPLAHLWKEYATAHWHWFEPYLTYDNARLVEAVYRVGQILDHGPLLRIARDAAAFLTEHSFADDTTIGKYLEPVGNAGWWQQGGIKARFDQQTLEAGAYAELYRCLGDTEHERLALDWFHGRNFHGLPIYDLETGGCYDSLTADGINRNMGAESVLSYLLAVTARRAGE